MDKTPTAPLRQQVHGRQNPILPDALPSLTFGTAVQVAPPVPMGPKAGLQQRTQDYYGTPTIKLVSPQRRTPFLG